jgi:uncharacterized OB-fold protein
MTHIQHVLADAECTSVEQFMRFCERETRVSSSPMPLYRCDDCGRRAVPGQIRCTQCLDPRAIGAR